MHSHLSPIPCFLETLFADCSQFSDIGLLGPLVSFKYTHDQIRLSVENIIKYILNKRERYIKFSLKLRVYHLKIVKQYIVIYNQQCFMVDMSCSGDR